MDYIIENILKNEKEYRCLPFWSWNDYLEENELIEQINKMNEQGIGGFFMHARGGLLTEYLSEDWFNAISVCVNEAKKHGMKPWCYDEEGWPSGFAGGRVPSKSYDYTQKRLLFSKDKITEYDKCLGFFEDNINGEVNITNELNDNVTGIYVVSNKYYIDALNEKCINYFIEQTHNEYYKRFNNDFGKLLSGFFTDEPQFAFCAIPWTDNMPKIFTEKYGYDLVSKLNALVLETKGYAKVRNDFWCLVNELFTNNFIKQMYDWCKGTNAFLTGHVMAEESLISQMAATAGAMPTYEYFDMPGMDWLGRTISNPIMPKQVSSVCEQLGKQKAITETYALCGWDVSFEELKWIAEWQYVNGINMMCQHLEGYTIRGFRKRDYPPSLFIQQPWWEEYKNFNSYFSRLGAALSLGKANINILLIHPIRSAYVTYDGSNNENLKQVEESFLKTTTRLNELHIEHHYGDETILKKYGSVSNGKIIVGKSSYDAIILPELINISNNTLNFIHEFLKCNGKVFRTGTLPVYVEGEENHSLFEVADKILLIDLNEEQAKNLLSNTGLKILENGKECPSVHIRSRDLGDGTTIIFAVNLDNKNGHSTTIIPQDGKYISILNILDMEYLGLNYVIEAGHLRYDVSFKPTQSYLFVQSDKEFLNKKPVVSEKIKINDTFNVDFISSNAITLDKCNYRINDSEWLGEKPVILIQQELLRLKKECTIEMEFTFKTENLNCKVLELVLECPEKFSISVNSQNVEYIDHGYFVDKSFRKIDIKKYIINGENKILLKGEFYQNQKVYDVLFGRNIHETERNKLTYDTELESIYLVGDFLIKNNGSFTYGDRKSILEKGDFSLINTKNTLEKGDFTTQGLWFFTGSLIISQNISVNKDESKCYVLEIGKINAPLYKLRVNSKEVATVMWTQTEFDVTDYIKDGDNVITLELFSSNRNLLGPHHFVGGESYFVSPSTFTDDAGWSEDIKGDIWNNDYCFVKFGF